MRKTIHDELLFNHQQHYIIRIENKTALLDLTALGFQKVHGTTGFPKGYVAKFFINEQNELILEDLKVVHALEHAPIINHVVPTLIEEKNKIESHLHYPNLQYKVAHTGVLQLSKAQSFFNYLKKGNHRNYLDLVFENGVITK